MAEDILKTINELLNEEKWTRATLNSYSINNFKELDNVIRTTTEEGLREEVKALCDEHLQHTKNSIIALYISGVFALSKHLVDDSHLVILINIFADNHKWNIVEYLCKRILDFGENKFALRTLAESYINKNEENKKYKIWERLIKVDYEETEIVRQLAEKMEEDGDLEGAVEYYKKALHRYINKRMYSNVKDIWVKLIEYVKDDLDFFFNIEKKIVKYLSKERAASLLELLFPVYIQREEWDAAIEIARRILSYNPKDFNTRKQLIDCFKQKYKDHSHLDDYIKISNLNQTWRNVHEAIADFKKHISFDEGNFVYHRSWGIGKIVNIKDDIFVIDFANKKNHKMSLKMAVSALKTLGKEHIWVLKATKDKKELAKQIEEDPVWALKIIIKSFENIANMKQIKTELVPDLFSAGKWSKWSTEARKILKTNPIFGNYPDKLDNFMVRDKPISFEEKTFNKFKAEKNFFNRVKTIQDFLNHSDPDSEYFNEMFSYFVGFAKSYSSVTELVISSFLLIQKIIAVYPFLNPELQYNFKELLDQTEDKVAVFSRIDDSELKKEFLIQLKQHIEGWEDYFIDLFRFYLNRFIIEELIAHKCIHKITELFNNLLNHYREFREPFIWFVRNMIGEQWFAKLGVENEKILICMIHLFDITFREIKNRRDVSLNRKLNKQIQHFLFEEDRLLNHIMNSDEDSITRLYTLVEDIKDLDPSIKIQLKQKIKSKFPSFHFIGEHEKEKVRGRLIVTRTGYQKKQNTLKHIIEVEIPENSKEIGVAMKKGDLRENAEYKAALEKQELLKTSASKLQDELQNAEIFNENDANLDKVSFGTTVELFNLQTEENEEYTIFGPWESDPGKNIISYLSPLGTSLYNQKVGQELKFKINEQEFHYQIKKIEKAVL
ncbi:MAG: transcription elongation factor GreA [Spirochaetales bacterium]|nr:transcription elongation factor GreA [Spirochaetales bacterium]